MVETRMVESTRAKTPMSCDWNLHRSNGYLLHQEEGS